MNINKIISAGIKEFKLKFRENSQIICLNELTPERFLDFSNCLKNALGAFGKQILIDYISSFDEMKPSMIIEGREYKLKLKSEKKFLSFFGEIQINRCLYQHDRGRETFIPLDEKWGVKNEYAAPDVQEATLYSSAHMIPKETEALFKKCAFFNPSSTAITNMVEK